MGIPHQRRSGISMILALITALALVPLSTRANDVPELDITSYLCPILPNPEIDLPGLVERCEIGAAQHLFQVRDTGDRFDRYPESGDTDGHFTIEVPTEGYFHVWAQPFIDIDDVIHPTTSRVFCTDLITPGVITIPLDVYIEVEPERLDPPLNNKLLFEDGWPEGVESMSCLWFSLPLDSEATPAA